MSEMLEYQFCTSELQPADIGISNIKNSERYFASTFTSNIAFCLGEGSKKNQFKRKLMVCENQITNTLQRFEEALSKQPRSI